MLTNIANCSSLVTKSNLAAPVVTKLSSSKRTGSINAVMSIVLPTGIGSTSTTVPFGLIVQSVGSTNTLLNLIV